jgi:hypothetical protein
MDEILVGYLPHTSQPSCRQGQLARCGLVHARFCLQFCTYRLLEARILHMHTWNNNFTGLTFIWAFIFGINIWILVANGDIIGWGIMLQAARSRIRFPMRSLEFFNVYNPSSRTMAPGSTQPLTEMSTRNFPGGKERPTRKAYNLTAICERTV